MRAQQLFSTPIAQAQSELVHQTLPMAQGKRQFEQTNSDILAPAERTDAPLCGNHQTPMVWQKGRKGYFWSCHEKMTDGGWCSYRP
jgi:hypothetical protein